MIYTQILKGTRNSIDPFSRVLLESDQSFSDLTISCASSPGPVFSKEYQTSMKMTVFMLWVNMNDPPGAHDLGAWLLADGLYRKQWGPKGSDTVPGFNFLVGWEMKSREWGLLGGSRSLRNVLERCMVSLAPTTLCFQLQ